MINRTVITRISIESALILAFWIGPSLAAEEISDAQATNALAIESVTVQGKMLRPNPGKELSLGALPENVVFSFGPLPSGRTPMRLRYKLEGYDNGWHDGGGEMFLGIRFSDDAGEQVAFKDFKVMRESTGWAGTLEGSALTHRREVVTVPPRATQWQVIMSSAGPPSTVGIYVVDDLVVSKFGGTNQAAEVLMRAPFSGLSEDNRDPQGWVRDGIRPRMAKIIDFGRYPKTKAFAILDDDPFGHAEWRNIKGSVPRVVAGDNLVLEWNELFSMGVGDLHYASYAKL